MRSKTKFKRQVSFGMLLLVKLPSIIFGHKLSRQGVNMKACFDGEKDIVINR